MRLLLPINASLQPLVAGEQLEIEDGEGRGAILIAADGSELNRGEETRYNATDLCCIA